MKTWLLSTLLALALFSFCGRANAQIGWTLEECRQFYGKSTELARSVGRDVSFQVGGLEAVACFMADTDAVGKIYFFKEKPHWGDKLTSKEIDALLRLNGDGILWRPEGLDGAPHERRYPSIREELWLWTGYDKSGRAVLTAQYADDSEAKDPRPTLTISTLDYANAEHERLSKFINRAQESATPTTN